MATLTLDPGDSFENYHSMETSITPSYGRVELICKKVKTQLASGTKVVIPAKTFYTLANVGVSVASVDCRTGK